jgi:glycosyltransferase involved in cell wall biosynthesis
VRITFVLPVANLSGGTRVVAIYARELVRMGHVVSLVSSLPKRMSLREKLRRWIKGRGWMVEPARRPSHLDNSGLDHRVLDRSRPVVDDDVPDADVVIATWWETAEWVDALSAEKGAKAYFIQHHEVFPHLPVERCRATYRLRFHKIVVANWLRQVMSAEYGDAAVDLVPNSVDGVQFFSAFRTKQVIPTVGFLYSSVDFKGVDISLVALKKVRERIPQLRIVSFGSQRPVPELAMFEGTEYFLSPAQDQIRNIYSSCDVWVTASRSEGFNLPAMEAMACRTPVVATRTGWPEEAIKSGENGVLVDVDDVDGLTRAVEWILSQTNEAWETISLKAFETVAESSWEASAAMFEQALKNACFRAARGEIAGGC